MARAKEKSTSIAQQLDKFERTAHKTHDRADKVHRKTEEMHMEAHATRERARAMRQKDKKPNPASLSKSKVGNISPCVINPLWRDRPLV